MDMFSNILLDDDQKNLLCQLIEASRNVPMEARQRFYTFHVFGENHPTVFHKGLPDGKIHARLTDIELLAKDGLVILSYAHNNLPEIDITPLGFRYYEHIKKRLGEPLSILENSIRQYLDSESFACNFPEAYEKWCQAEKLLWESENKKHYTIIGHLCREAMQAFADEIVIKVKVPIVDSNKAHTVKKIRNVLQTTSTLVTGKTNSAFLEALLAYWGTVSDLAQRQEHGEAKKGDDLVWEDARRIVFQSFLVMYEIGKVYLKEKVE